ncbi:hypothetical protein MRX96_036884 [Rhipicephalus microplus]
MATFCIVGLYGVSGAACLRKENGYVCQPFPDAGFPRNALPTPFSRNATPLPLLKTVRSHGWVKEQLRAGVFLRTPCSLGALPYSAILSGTSRPGEIGASARCRQRRKLDL